MQDDSSSDSASNRPSRGLYFVRGLFCVALSALVYVSLLPATSLMQTGLWDKLEHFIAYAVVAIIGSAAFPTSSAARPLGIALVALGVVLELAQTQVPGRAGDPIDALANGLGVLTGIAVTRIARGPR